MAGPPPFRTSVTLDGTGLVELEHEDANALFTYLLSSLRMGNVRVHYIRLGDRDVTSSMVATVAQMRDQIAR